MTRHFDKQNRVEVGQEEIPEGAKLPPNIVALPDSHPFFSPLPDGHEVAFDIGGLPLIVEVTPPTLDEVKSEKLSLIRDAAEGVLRSFTEEYPQHEQATWRKQESQARAWGADNTIMTLTIDNIFEERVVAEPTLTKQALVNLIITKADFLEDVSSRVVGRRQLLERQVLNATTKVEVSAVKEGQLAILATSFI